MHLFCCDLSDYPWDVVLRWHVFFFVRMYVFMYVRRVLLFYVFILAGTKEIVPQRAV